MCLSMKKSEFSYRMVFWGYVGLLVTGWLLILKFVK